MGNLRFVVVDFVHLGLVVGMKVFVGLFFVVVVEVVAVAVVEILALVLVYIVVVDLFVEVVALVVVAFVAVDLFDLGTIRRVSFRRQCHLTASAVSAPDCTSYDDFRQAFVHTRYFMSGNRACACLIEHKSTGEAGSIRPKCRGKTSFRLPCNAPGSGVE